MGYHQSAYVMFGAQVDATRPYDLQMRFEDGEVDFALFPGVRYLMAGDWDRNWMFLVTYCKEAELSQYVEIQPDNHLEDRWSRDIRSFADYYDLPLTNDPVWLVVSDVS